MTIENKRKEYNEMYKEMTSDNKWKDKTNPIIKEVSDALCKALDVDPHGGYRVVADYRASRNHQSLEVYLKDEIELSILKDGEKYHFADSVVSICVSDNSVTLRSVVSAYQEKVLISCKIMAEVSKFMEGKDNIISEVVIPKRAGLLAIAEEINAENLKVKELHEEITELSNAQKEEAIKVIANAEEDQEITFTLDDREQTIKFVKGHFTYTIESGIGRSFFIRSERLGTVKQMFIKRYIDEEFKGSLKKYLNK